MGVPPAQRDQILQRQNGDACGRGRLVPADLQSQGSERRLLLCRDRRRDRVQQTPATCTLKGGVVANNSANTITINLVKPDSEFKYKLAVPFASIVPADSPPKDVGTKPLPGTGAYYFASYDPNKQLVMKRNPYFKQWSQAAQPAGYPDEITQSYGLTAESQITAVENGQ